MPPHSVSYLQLLFRLKNEVLNTQSNTESSRFLEVNSGDFISFKLKSAIFFEI